MAELLGILVEGLVALITLVCELIAAWGHLLLEGLAVLGCFLFSRRFRARRLELWRAQPRRKIVDLSLAFAWLVVIVGVPLLVFWPAPAKAPRGQPVSAHPVAARPEEDLRLELRLQRTNSPAVAGTIVVRKGGVGKILESQSLADLKTQLVRNVTLLPGSTPSTAVSATNAPITTNRSIAAPPP